ncbi:hypothetical protein HYX01_02390 [Candidatus Woesearchaeota archaeon]|nr:hypothetical protein [Candidatus Woesearchaeota archaeon]
MKVEHLFGKRRIEKDAKEDVGFMLTNKNGSYAFLREKPTSRYEGIFLFDGKNMYRLIESINAINGGAVKKIKNHFYFAEQERENITEKFFMPVHYSSLIYELSNENEISIVLDCKDSYDNDEFGRHYDIFEEKGCIIAKFTKRADGKANSIDGMEQYTLYLAIKPDKMDYKKIGSWIKRDYAFDEKRNSMPYSRYVFEALQLKGKIFVMAMSKDKNGAIKDALGIFKNLEGIKKNEETAFSNAFLQNPSIKKVIQNRKISNEIKMAYASALNSLQSLAIGNANSQICGIFAGLPWFFQFWSRDEAISLKALSKIDYQLAKKIIMGRMRMIQNDGRLPNIYYQGNYKTNADAIGWLFKMALGFCNEAKKNLIVLEQLKAKISSLKNRKIKRKKIIMMLNSISGILNAKEMENKSLVNSYAIAIQQSIKEMMANYAKDGLMYNSNKDTWMDTDFDGNGRKGFCIEIQSLALEMHKAAFHATKKNSFEESEKIIKEKVLEKFWNGNLLKDNLSDSIIRANAFIAHHIYPELLNNDEWERCFEILLQNLWLEFGVSTIDKSNPLFTAKHTGEFAKSYHLGDSWFWINNLAAISLFKINKKKFKEKITKIINASAEEILWKGIIGAHSELSSAESLNSEGCLNQSWSNAMFVEAIDVIANKT